MANPHSGRRTWTLNDAMALVEKATDALQESYDVLSEAREIATRAGLSVDSSILDSSYQSPFLPTHFQHNSSHDATHDMHDSPTPSSSNHSDDTT